MKTNLSNPDPKGQSIADGPNLQDMNSNEQFRLETSAAGEVISVHTCPPPPAPLPRKSVRPFFQQAFFGTLCLVTLALTHFAFAADLPPSKGSAADFPGVVWKNRLAEQELWSKGGWRLEENNLFVKKDQAFCPFPEKLADEAIRVRFQYDGSENSFIDLLLRSDGRAANVRYVVTTFIGKEADHQMSANLRYQDSGGDHGPLGGSGKLGALKEGDQHTLEFYALGDYLAYYLDGKLIAAVHDPKLISGQVGLFTGSHLHFVSVETAELSALRKPATTSAAK
jgi:hypothetical protein